MYFVATPEKPLFADKLHYDEVLADACAWAKREAEKRHQALDVRAAVTGRISRSYSATGATIPPWRR